MSGPVIDLRKKTTPPAPVKAMSSVTGSGPLPTGRISGEEFQRRIASSNLKALIDPPTAKPTEQPAPPLNPVPLDSLPAEKQQELLQGLEQFQQLQPDQGTEVWRAPQEKTQPKEADPTPEKPPSGMSPMPKSCPHCGWDQDKADPTDADSNDKLVFIQAVLGQKRFQKEYNLLGGRVRVVFRTLTTEEADLCWKQAAVEAEAGVLIDSVQYLRTVNDYRLCLGLASLDLGSNRQALPELHGYKVDPPAKGQTILKPIVNYVYDQVLVQEHIRSACAQAWWRFQRLSEFLWNHLDDANFWPATEGQP